MTWKTLELEREGAILRVWLNRPEKRNAIDEEMLREVGDLSHALEADFETRVIVLADAASHSVPAPTARGAPPLEPLREQNANGAGGVSWGDAHAGRSRTARC